MSPLEPVRVLHVITNLDTGGAETFLLNLIRATRVRGVSNAVLTVGRGGGLLDAYRTDGIPVHEIGVSPGARALGFIGLLPRLRRIVRSVEPQIIQGWLNHGNLAAWAARRLTVRDTRLIWSVRQTIYDLGLEKWGTRAVIRALRTVSGSPDAVLFNSDLARIQHAELGFETKRALVLPNGFDVDRFRPNAAAREATRRALGWGSEVPVIGMVARVHPMKDYASFFRAIAEVARSLDVRVLCVGRGVEADSFAQLARQHAIEDRCRMLGERDDLERIYPALDIFCLTSAWGEAFPNVVAEAMSCGVPTVVTDVGEAARIVGDAGYVIPPRDSGEIARAVIRILRMPAGERATLGAGARERIVAQFSIGAVADRYRALYERLISANVTAVRELQGEQTR